jgi:deoxyribonuclease-4
LEQTVTSPAQRNPIGAHVPVAGGLVTGALGYADAIGAETVQVFVTNPRGWATPEGDPDADAAFAAACAERGTRAFVHATYLINVGSPNQDTVANSVAVLRHTLRRAAEIGAEGVVVHTGSAVTTTSGSYDRALRQVRERLRPLLDGDGPPLLLEPTAGQGRSLCSTVDDLERYLDLLDRHPRVGICLDTCHAFAAGHDLAAPGGGTATLDRLVEVAGAGRLRLVHANDSKDGVGSAHDRHENIGAGRIGADAFGELLAHPSLRGVPLVIETPGPRAAHAADIARLKKLRESAV